MFHNSRCSYRKNWDACWRRDCRDARRRVGLPLARAAPAGRRRRRRRPAARRAAARRSRACSSGRATRCASSEPHGQVLRAPRRAAGGAVRARALGFVARARLELRQLRARRGMVNTHPPGARALSGVMLSKQWRCVPLRIPPPPPPGTGCSTTAMLDARARALAADAIFRVEDYGADACGLAALAGFGGGAARAAGGGRRGRRLRRARASPRACGARAHARGARA